MAFQISALDHTPFSDLFEMDDEALASRKAVRSIVTETPGTPCRVSLEDAQVGEEVVLVNHCHQLADTPYQASHAVFIRRDVKQVFPEIDAVPILFRHRLISVRGFNQNDMMVDADAVEGTLLEQAIEKLFSDERVSYIHLHYAKPGCFAAKVERA